MAAKICPKVEELEPTNSKQKTWTCSEQNCGQSFTSISARSFHQIKVHNLMQQETYGKTKDKYPRDKTQYHCPIEPCVYNLRQGRHFTSLASLKQHYLKVHKEKLFPCGLCNKKYATQTLLRLHEAECGILFKCGSCDKAYSSKSTLQTHCRRNLHLFQLNSENLASKKFKQNHSTPHVTSMNSDTFNNSELQVKDKAVGPLGEKCKVTDSSELHCPLMPKLDALVICFDKNQQENAPTVILVAGVKHCIPKKQTDIRPKPEVKSTISTDPCRNRGMSCTGTLAEIVKQNTETQTENITPVINVQDSAVQAKPRKRNVVAQTTGDYILKTAMKQADLPMGKPSTRSRTSNRESAGTQCSHTQTAPVKKRKNASRGVNLLATSHVKQDNGHVDNQTSFQSTNADVDTDVHVDDLQELLAEFSRSNNQTQTTTQWEDIQPCMAENNSTQTAESFLAASLNCQFHNSSSIETQTAVSMKQVSCCNPNSQNSVCSTFPSVETFLQNSSESSSYYHDYREVMLSDSANEVPCIGHEITVNNTCTTIETQTMFPDFSPAALDNHINVRNVNMETQTLSADIVDEFLNHMETQTSEDIFADLGLADMETQTTFNLGTDDDMDFTNVETQTSLHAHNSSMLNTLQSTDMETQTFFPSLETFITGHSDIHTQTDTLADLEQLMSHFVQS